MNSIRIDIHTHSIASGHATTDTITDMSKEASSRGLQVLAITEHGPATLGSCTSSYFRSLKNAPRKRFGVELLYGCEVNILDCEGKLDLEDPILKDLDLNIASLHTQNIKPGSVLENTRAVIAAIRNPYIHIIGHPDDEKYELDYELIIKEAMNNHVLLELNNSSLNKGGYRGDTKANDIKYLTLCKNHSYPIVLGSDSHGKEHIGEFKEALSLLNQLEFPKELILNYDDDLFHKWIK
ncbi:MAG: Histidinol phosphatase and related hydrolase of the family [Herbinix sp.]|nr:Histidinol phosphatase and related hydrolase of the family [Herbinix sp.]